MNRISFFAILLFTQGCHFDPYGKDNDKEYYRNLRDAFLILLIRSQIPPPPPKLMDNKNGFVTYTSYNSSGGSYSNTYKKCLQGQVYRQTQNDCQGTGALTNNYGAIQLAYNNNVAQNSCDTDLFINNPDASEIDYRTSYKSLAITPEFSEIYSHIPRTLPIWARYDSHENMYIYFTIENLQSSTTILNDSPTALKYILCWGRQK